MHVNWENSQEKVKMTFSYSYSVNCGQQARLVFLSSFLSPRSSSHVLHVSHLLLSFFFSFSRLRSFYLMTSRWLGKSLPLFISPLSLDHSLAPLFFLSLLWTIYSFLFACHRLVHPVPSLTPSNILLPFPWNIFSSLNSLRFWSR